NQDLNLLDKDQNLDAQQNHSSFFDATEKDRDFWHNALSQVEELHPLPWANALESIDTPVYARQTVVIEKAKFDAVSKLAGQYKVFPNALLTTLVLDVISHWTEEQKLLVSMPVYHSALHKRVGNSSSFIVVDYAYCPDLGSVDQVKDTQKK
ncbi:non-ribosomal peptide synthetase, partial [Escherichia coli]